MTFELRLGLACASLTLFSAVALAADFGWDNGVGDNTWNGLENNNGVQTNWLGANENIPQAADTILLEGTSLPGPQTIDLEGLTQEIFRVEADGVQGAYTFDNGTLQINHSGVSSILADNGGGELVFNTDLHLNSAGLVTLNVQPSGDKITVMGDVSSSAASGVTNLLITSSNTSLPVGVEIGGVISDGTAQTALEAGFSGNLLHTGAVRVTGANTYTGSTRVFATMLEFDSIADVGGGPNALGQPALVDSTILLGTSAPGTASTGGLRYIGSGHTSNRVIELAGKNNDTERIEASGSGALVLTGGITNPSNGEILVLGGVNTDDNTISGAIQGGVGSAVTSLRKEGGGKWILSGSSPTLDGTISVVEGHLVLSGQIGSTSANASTLAITSAGEFTVDGGYLAVGNLNQSSGGVFNFESGTVRVTGGNNSGAVVGSLDIGTSGAATLQLQGGSKVFDDVVVNGADDTIELGGTGTWAFDKLDNSNGGTLTFTGGTLSLTDGAPGQGLITGAGVIGGTLTGVGDVTKVGPGTLTVNLNTHTNTGDTNINSGVLEVAASGRLSDGSTVNVASGAALRFLTSSGDAIFGLNGAGAVELGDAGLVLGNFSGAGGAGGVGTFTGTISDGPGPAEGAFEKRGTGVFNFGGNATYKGATTITSGTMNVTGSIIGTSGVTLSTATLSVNGGTIDTPGNVRPNSNSAIFNLTSGLVKANAIDRTVNSQYLHQFNWTGGTVHLLSPTAINGSTTTAIDRPFGPSLTLDSDMALVVDNIFSVTGAGVLNINGGSVTVDTIVTGGAITFNSGTMHLRDDQTFSASRLAALDIDAPLGSNRSLVVDGVATINAPLVLAGGTFSAGSIVNPEDLILSSGTLNITAGDLDVAAATSLDVTSGMVVQVSSGALNVANGGELNAINAVIDAAGGIHNDGDVNLINSTVSGSLVNGTGGSANLLGSNTFNGDLVLSDSSNLFIEIGGSGTGEFDVVSIFANSTATVDGLLNVSLSGGFNPTAGQQFQVLTAAAVVDNGLVLGGSAAGRFNLLVDGSAVVLLALAGIDGDYNNDGAVDLGDYTLWRDNLGAAEGTLPNDPNSGVIGTAQYATWKTNFGATAAAFTTESANVPEPSGLVLLGLSVVLAVKAVRWPIE